MKRLCIGIHNLTPGWQVILDQIGVCYEPVDYQKQISSSYSLILLNSSPSVAQKELLNDYVSTGGAILETEGVHLFVKEKHLSEKNVAFILNEEEHPAFLHIPVLELNHHVIIHQKSELFEGLIYFKRKSNGFLAYLGLKPDELIAVTKYARKRFYFKPDKHPDELACIVDKHALTELIIAIFKELHFNQGLPFVNKWISPTPKPIFAFRIDSDYGTKDSIQKLYQLAILHEIKFTWFLHVNAHKDWLDYFHEFENQEIALHGNLHGTSTSKMKVGQNIAEGMDLLQKKGLQISGYCAPYGIWNKAVAEAVTKYKFEYSSEFTIGYDGVPFSPICKQSLLSAIQIPIHPVCTGSLSRKRASIAETAEYFEMILDQKLARFEPVVLYHHPLQPGLDVLNHIFKKIKTLNLTNLTFSEFSEFWKQRTSQKIELMFHNKTISLTTEALQNPLFVQISTSHTGFDLVPATNQNFELTYQPKFKYGSLHLPDKKELANLWSNKLALVKTSLMDWNNRHYL